MDDKKERARFVRWVKKEYPGTSIKRYGKPAQDQYILEQVQNAWLGWSARANINNTLTS